MPSGCELNALVFLVYGSHHQPPVYVLTASRKTYGWGLNPNGAIARNGFADVLSPTQLYPSLIAGVTAICNAGDDGIIFRIVTARGRAWCCVIG